MSLIEFKLQGRGMYEIKRFQSDKPNKWKPDPYTSVIGDYTDEDNNSFHVFTGFNKRCPQCKKDIFEPSCYSCCHKNNCGKVNYGLFCIDYDYLDYDLVYLRFNYEDGYASLDTLNSCTFKDIPSKLFHHICYNCKIEFYSLSNDLIKRK